MTNRERDWIAEALGGKVSPQDPRVLAAFAENPDLEEEYRELEELEELLRTDAKHENQCLREPLTASVGQQREAAHPPLPWLRHAAVAAIVLVICALSFWQTSQLPDNTDSRLLGQGDLSIEGISPVGDRASFLQFQITKAIPSGARCELTVWDATANDSPFHVERITYFEPVTNGTLWEPEPTLLESMPTSIRWGFTVTSVEGQIIASASDLFASQ